MSRRRPALFAPEPIANLLARAGEGRFSPVVAPVPPDVWAAAVGPRVAERTRPEKLEAGVLYVRTATSAWASELSLLSADILPRLRSRGILVDRLRFRVGTVEAPMPVERRPGRVVPAAVPLPPDLRAQVASIEDDELRLAVLRAAEANLAWQKHVAPLPAPPPRAARPPRDD